MNLNSVAVVPKIPCGIKINPVLGLVYSALFVVPFKFHAYIIDMLYKIATKKEYQSMRVFILKRKQEGQIFILDRNVVCWTLDRI